MSPKRILGLAIAASILASFAALAATETPERVRGTIASATADSVTGPAVAAVTGDRAEIVLVRGGGGGGFHGGGFHGGGFHGGGYRGGYYHGGFYHGGYYHGGFYPGYIYGYACPYPAYPYCTYPYTYPY